MKRHTLISARIPEKRDKDSILSRRHLSRPCLRAGVVDGVRDLGVTPVMGVRSVRKLGSEFIVALRSRVDAQEDEWLSELRQLADRFGVPELPTRLRLASRSPRRAGPRPTPPLGSAARRARRAKPQ